MYKNITTKIKLSLVLILFLLTCMVAGSVLFAKAEDSFVGAENLSLTIDEGHVHIEGDEGKNRLQFTISLPEKEYLEMISMVGEGKTYNSIETGVVIAPDYYNDNAPIGYDTLFGNNKTYDWANYIDGEYKYTESDKIRVININANDWRDRGNYYSYSGAIVDILEENESEIFSAIGYVRLVDNAGVESYKFTSLSKASAISTALKDIKNGLLDQDQIDWVKTNWIQDRLGIVDNETPFVNTSDISSYSFYDLIDDENALKILNGLGDQSALDFVITDENRNQKTLSLDEFTSFDVKNEKNLRLWTASVKCGDFVIWTGKVDLYSTSGEFLWNDEYTTNALRESDFKSVDGQNVYRIISYRGTTVEINGGIGVSYSSSGRHGSWIVWKPLHTKEYYEMFTGKNLAIRISLSSDTSSAKVPGEAVFNQGYVCGNGSKYLPEPKTDATITGRYSLDTIVEKWTQIIDARWDLDGSVWANRHKYGMALVYNVKNGGKFVISNLGVEITTAEITGEERLVDTDKFADLMAVNLLDALSKADKTAIEEYLHFGMTAELRGQRVLDSIVINDITSVDISALSEGAYTLTIKSYGVLLYTGTLDFYSSSKSAVWASDLSQSAIVGRVETTDDELGWTNKSVEKLLENEGYEVIDASTVTDEDSPLYGKTGKFVKMTSVSQIEQMTFTVLPVHSKTYYKKLLGEKDYVLTFDTYVSGSLKGMSAIGAYYNKDTRYDKDYATWRGTSPGVDKWVRYSIPFDSYLIPTDNDESFSGHYFDFNATGSKVSSNQTMFQFESRSVGAVIYIGLPYIDTMPEFIHFSSTERTVEMLGSNHYDLTGLFTESELNKYNYYGTKYGFDKIFYKLTFADDSTTHIWAKEDGSIDLNLLDVVGTTDAGASITIRDKIELGAFTINGRLCDVHNFPGHNNVGVFGQVSGANNNQHIVKTGKITLTDLPSPTEVYEISTANSTVKIFKEDHTNSTISSKYTEGGIETLYQDSVQDLDKALRITAFQNDVEAGQIQIVSKRDLAEYDIVLSDLRCGDKILSKDNFSAYHLLYTHVLRVSAGSLNPTGTGLYPDAILPMADAKRNEVNTLTAGTNQGVWISVHVPMDQPAGEYTGIFRLILSESIYEIPVSVTVYDYAVSEETQMTVAIGLSYSNIANLELPYEYDEDGKLIVNSSGNKTGTLDQEIIDAYVKLWTDHRLSTSPVSPISSHFSGSWQGYPYDPEVLFSFEEITVKGKTYYAYEWPLRNKDANGNTYLIPNVDTRQGYETHGYPLYLNRVDAYFNGLVELAGNQNVTYYTIPVGQAPASNFNNDNINALYNGKWRGQMSEIRNDMADGEKAYVINQLVLRDAMEMFFQKTMELHKAGNSVDVFKKARLYPTWIDEFGINESKTFNAQHLLKYMKDFFPNLSNWLKRVYADQINGDEFLLSVLDSISKIKIGVTTNTLEDIDASEHYANVIAVIGQYGSEAGRDEIDAWLEQSYGGEAERWVYTAGNSFPQSSNNIENTIVGTRSIGWMMSEYDIEGWLYWASMNSKYMDGIVSSTIAPIVGETVKDGDIIKLDDFYNNAIHYGGVPGDGFLIYPGAYYGIKGPVSSIRLEALTDGIEDYNLFSDLKAMYKDAGVEEAFYGAMRRLCEMIYTGVSLKAPAGYTDDFMVSRSSLASMLVLARDHKIFVDGVYKENGEWVFGVIAPKDLAEDLKSQIDATFISSTDLVVGGVDGVKLLFKVSATMAENGYVCVPYGDEVINLSVETLIETEIVEQLKWAEVSSETPTTYHLSYYSNGASNTSVNTEIVTLSEENAVGGRTSGDYYFVSPNGNETWNMGFAVLPTMIDKETIGQYFGKAQLAFDIYMDSRYIADGSIREGWKVWYKLGKSTNSQTECNEWFTVKIDFKQIYDNWDTLMNTDPATYRGANDDWSTSRRALFAVNGNSHSAAGVHTTSFYIGNFRIVHT